MKPKSKAIRNSIIAIFVVLAINFVVLYSLDFPLMAMDIINKYWILLVLLIGGFGLQVGLFTYYNSLNAISCSTSVASGGISGISMILCCSHYLLNILPFLGALIGVSALTALTKYTPYFFGFGILSNAVGVGIIYFQKNKFKKNE